MNSVNITLSEVYSFYKDWVCRNPQTASEVETTVKWLSYFIAGKINKSIVLTELVYSASNLLVLFNDLIINSTKQKLGSTSQGDKIKIWLTVLEYSEVFIEMSSKAVWGEKGKWIVIVCIQLVKCAAKLILLLHYKEKMMNCPPVQPCKRTQEREVGGSKGADGIPRISNIAFCLKRSGRIIRKVDSAPPLNCRLWKPPTLPSYSHNNNLGEQPDKALLQKHLIGEVMYIVKPIVNLVFRMKYGQTWKPWTVSAALDVISLYLLLSKSPNQKSTKFTPSQLQELSRRRLYLLLYLMRSPFYEKHSKGKIIAFLDSLSRNVPLGKFIFTPIGELLPRWEDTYFYQWSS